MQLTIGQCLALIRGALQGGPAGFGMNDARRKLVHLEKVCSINGFDNLVTRVIPDPNSGKRSPKQSVKEDTQESAKPVKED